jgi:MarR family transcriptional regulator, temperature-dependent positive regulator of motility
MLTISTLVKLTSPRESAVNKVSGKPGHLARRFQQIAVAIFLSEVSRTGSDLTPVQYAALAMIAAQPGVDQATLAGLIAYDRTTIGGVVDRLVEKGCVTRTINPQDRRARILDVTCEGKRTLSQIEPAVEAAQRAMLSGLTDGEATELMRLLGKAIDTLNDHSRAPLRSGRPESGS